MLYICIPSHDEARTIGLLLWKIRKTLQAFPREYQLLVADDGSTDGTAELLEPYGKVLPLTVVRHGQRLGHGRTLDELLGLALERSDRPRRDAAIVLHADFAHGPEVLPDIIRRLEGGADVVVAEARELSGQPSRGYRWVRRGARWLLRGVRVRGVRDIVSGYAAFRLSCLEQARRDRKGPFLTTDGWAANAELIARTARFARRVETVPMVERHDLKLRPSRVDPWPLARQLWREGGRLNVKGAPRDRAPSGGAPAADDQELEEAAR